MPHTTRGVIKLIIVGAAGLQLGLISIVWGLNLQPLVPFLLIFLPWSPSLLLHALHNTICREIISDLSDM